MHIERGKETGAKLVLSCATGIAMGCVVAKLVVEAIRERGALSFAMQAIAATALVFTFLEILPHFAVGVSELHFVQGSTLFLLFGAAPAAFGRSAIHKALALSTAYQSGIVVWGAFWELYGAGFGAANLSNVASFAVSYAVVALAGPLADLAVLALAKQWAA